MDQSTENPQTFMMWPYGTSLKTLISCLHRTTLQAPPSITMMALVKQLLTTSFLTKGEVAKLAPFAIFKSTRRIHLITLLSQPHFGSPSLTNASPLPPDTEGSGSSLSGKDATHNCIERLWPDTYKRAIVLNQTTLATL